MCTVADPVPDGTGVPAARMDPGQLPDPRVRQARRDAARDADGQPVAIDKDREGHLAMRAVRRPLTVTAEIYAWDLSVRGAHLDRRTRFFNGTCVFLSPVGAGTRACIVDIAPPAGDAYRDWRVITSLPRAGRRAYGFGTYRAPITTSSSIIRSRWARSRSGRSRQRRRPRHRDDRAHDCDMPRLTPTSRASARRRSTSSAASERAPPMDYYAFLTTALGEAHGGLEHRASTALVCSRDNLPHSGMKEPERRIVDFLGLASHEYFHTWCVKRIKPAAFVRTT
jgi:predicted metalloprotease with PDZ domain